MILIVFCSNTITRTQTHLTHTNKQSHTYIHTHVQINSQHTIKDDVCSGRPEGRRGQPRQLVGQADQAELP